MPENSKNSLSKRIDPSPGRGRLIILSAPSGAGKSTLCQALRRRFPELAYSVSHTTRIPRKGEENGKDYYFITEAEFKKNIQQGKWAEWAEVHGHFYGTDAVFLDTHLSAGRFILLDIDVAGARQILEKYPDSITIFVMPPSLDVLRQRLEKRGTDTPEVIAKRLENAKAEIAQKNIYRHVIVNDALPEAIKQLTAIIQRYLNGPKSDSRPRDVKGETD